MEIKISALAVSAHAKAEECVVYKVYWTDKKL